MYKQTLCFVKRNDELLMLNRENNPMQGLWNGVGGKIEENETPTECIVREVREETNIDISAYEVIDKGVISWEVDDSYVGGLHVYLVEIEDTYDYPTPKKTDEGILDWKKITWLLEDENFGVGEMIPHYLQNIINGEGYYNHSCTIKNKKLISYEMKKLELSNSK
ncbi:8-oxo-dGTP diphosphatase [Sporosarcina sp. D27]|uniref:NUDIX hydrolase n=1 Tax=Sporosarcina sp. D27 TaxID=1382305 RepID=UPI000470FFED|nr:8-oxo-dGTP diphosphatase [Sporosarcina sp. D27]